MDISKFDRLLQEVQKIGSALELQTDLLRAQMIWPDMIFKFWEEDREVVMFLPFAAHCGIQKRILKSATFYELRNLRRLREICEKNKNIIDVGANIGNHSIFFGLFCDPKSVYCFEPQSQACSVLMRNLQMNNLISTVIYQCVLGSSPGSASISLFKPGRSGSTSFTSTNSGQFEVKTLDGFAFDDVGLLKIDVEGGQEAVLKGARETIDRCRPLIACEIRRGKEDFDWVHTYLSKMGYKYEQLDKNNVLFRQRSSS